MKKIIHYIFILSLGLFYSCQEADKYKLHTDFFEVSLRSPIDEQVIDLGALDSPDFKFEWSAEGEEDCVLIVSTSDKFANLNAKNSKIIDVNQEQSYTIMLPALDYLAASLGVEAGGQKELYWTVKPKGDIRLASSEIHSFIIKRAKSTLLLPKDLSKEVLLKDKLDTEVMFKWESDNTTVGNYEIHFAASAEFNGELVRLPAGSNDETKISHEQLQKVFEELEYEKYQLAEVFWNVYNTNTNGYVSTTSSILYIDGVMTFTDVRGDESITYDVVRFDYTDGTSVVWLANNLRATKYPDGTDLVLAKEYGVAPSNLAEDIREAYGNYYTNEVKLQVAPNGWRVPTYNEVDKMFKEAMAQEGSYDVLKDPRYYAGISSPQANAWRMSLNSSGRMVTWVDNGVDKYDIVGYNGIWCYLSVSDLPDKVANHDGDEVVWQSPSDGGVIRLIYEGKSETN